MGHYKGRKIYDNIKKASIFIIAVHVPIAGLALLPLLDSAAPLILLPIHIVIIEMIIDPTCALVFEAEQPDRNLMKRPARPLDIGLFLPLVLCAPAGARGVCQGAGTGPRQRIRPGVGTLSPPARR